MGAFRLPEENHLMNVTVTLRGPSFGPFGKPTTITVAVDDLAVGNRQPFNLPSDVRKLIEQAVGSAVAGYEAVAAAERVDDPPAPAPSEERPDFAAAARFYAPWREWSDEAVYTPKMLGPLVPFLGEMSRALGHDHQWGTLNDWISQQRNAAGELTIFDVLVGETATVIESLLDRLTWEQIAEVDAQHGTAFRQRDPWLRKEAEGELDAIRQSPPDVPILPDPTPQASQPGTLEVRRCGDIGEHEPHTWRDQGGDVYQCAGEVF